MNPSQTHETVTFFDQCCVWIKEKPMTATLIFAAIVLAITALS